MSGDSKQLEGILNRLTAVEDHDRAKSTEIISLQRDNINLQKELFSNQKEIALLKEKVETLQSTNLKLEEKMSDLETKKKHSAAASTNISVKAKQLDDQMHQLQEIRKGFDKALTDANSIPDTLKNEVQELTVRTKQLQDIANEQAKSSIYVEIDTSGQFTTGQRNKLKLDVCTRVIKNSAGYFDVAKCCLDPQTDATYAMNIVFRQNGQGVIRMLGKGDGGVEFYVGKTDGDDSISSTLRLWRLKKGQKVWLEACRISGDATLRWCNFYCWLF